jgi:hypothetical protein
MTDNKKVMIPLSLMDKIIELLGYWDVSEYDPVIGLEVIEVLWQLDIKKRRLGLRDYYAKVIHTDNEDKRDDARIEYLKERLWLRENA